MTCTIIKVFISSTDFITKNILKQKSSFLGFESWPPNLDWKAFSISLKMAAVLKN